MECKVTSTRGRRARMGMTLVEVMITSATVSLAMAGIGALSVYTMRSFAAMANYMELDKNSRNALDRLTQIIREADGITSFNTNSIALSYHGQTMSFDYSAGQKTLTLTDTNGTTQVLLEDCDYLNFQTFQRNSMPGTYDQYPVTEDESAAKLVQVSWICSRRLIGNLLNTESVQSAKIVIRKQ